MSDTVGRTARPPRTRIIRNASIAVCAVLGIALVAVLAGRSAARPTPPASFGVTTLASRPAAPDFAPLTRGKLVPANVLAALRVPADATVVGRSNLDRGVDTFDRSVTYTSPASPATIDHFFPVALAHQQWRVVDSVGPILARLAGTDGFYWEVGVTVSPLSGDAADPGGSRFTVGLLQFQGEA
ncbi:MAG: hypothetical protein ACRDZQ_01565 [Acidimicrobiales bacterium]